MSWKSMVVLALLAAGLGGFFVYDSYWLTPAREKSEAVKGRLWTVEPRDVEAVTIKRRTETVKLRRAGDGWDMLEPVKARGDRGAVDGIVTTLATIRVDREIDPHPARPGDFGLEPPDAEVTLEVKGRKEPLALAIGGKSPTGAWVYGREGGKVPVFALSEVVSRDVSRPVADLRDRTVLAFDRKRVAGIDLEVGGEPISLEAQEGGKWRITRPRAYAADGDFVSEFLDKLESAKVKEFVGAGGTPASYGLDRPTTVTLLLGRDKERTAKTLLLGRVDGDKKAVYVMRPGEGEVLLVPEELWTAVPKTVGALRDKVVLAYALDKVKRVEVESPKGQVTIEKDGSGWKLAAPAALKADAAAVNGLLWSVRDLRSAGFLAEEPKDVGRYLARPEVTVRLWEEGAKEPRTLLLGPSRETRGGKPAALAAVAGQGPVVLVDARALADLAKTEDDLRDKTLFPAFEVADIKRVRVSGGGKQLLVERTGGSEWKLLEPSKGSAKDSRVTDLLFTLKALRWKAIVSAKGDDAARFGLDRPELEVTLQKGDGSEAGSLLVGRDEGALTYVRLKAGPAIFSVDGKAVGDLRKAPTQVPG